MNIQSQAKTEPFVRDSILARFMLGFDGDSVSSELADYLAQGLAGVVIYQRNFTSVEQLRDLTLKIRRAAGRPVLICIDQEGGTRFALREPFTQWPSPAELGRIGNLKYVEQIAHAMAKELRAVGCNLNFAPMLDLHMNSESAVTKDRSFGKDPRRVAEFGVAFDNGLRSGGVLSCAKHFPGHGDAIIDPHKDLPTYMGTLKELESSELVPFVAAARAGVPAIMTAHILLPLIDPENPASLSRFILTDTLRKRLGYDGVILADDLGMGAIAKRCGSGKATVKTLHAGTDIAMLCHDWSAVAPAITAVSKARQENQFAEEEWNASLHRIERCIAASETNEPQPGLEVIGCTEHKTIAADIRSRLS